MNLTTPTLGEPDPLFVAIRRYHAIYELLLAGLSFFLNGVVVYLALTMKNKTMRNYCRILLMSVMGDLIYTSLNLLTMTIVEIRAGMMYFITTGPYIHSTYPNNMLMCALWLTGMYFTIMTIMVQFVYRYYTLCKSGLSVTRSVLIYCLGMTWCIGQGFAAFLCFEPATERNTIILQGHPLYSFDTPTFVTGDTANLGPILHFACSQISVVVLYVIIVTTGKRIHKALNSDTLNMSKNTKNAQKKLNKVMVLQATYPGLIVGLPVVLATAMAQLKMDASWSGMYFAPSISTIPIINAFTVLLVIPSFRRRILGSKVSTALTSTGHDTSSKVDHKVLHLHWTSIAKVNARAENDENILNCY
ncbi:unnamed protein product [Bursaphelenchus xylophilus]|uniref:(pine wood nematode) hypothetical protein n=1 Tax=Bursaphelenchus xylophilus TaxID=6326 RepID=A0A1I7RWU7_BURXY|nr:unnamed protein product [Bursaphelenchus xylophilus]CAG9128711.1 unnamed protein product [Bursaphelenchus xylophilus]